jgi:hypothetical protein
VRVLSEEVLAHFLDFEPAGELVRVRSTIMNGIGCMPGMLAG